MSRDQQITAVRVANEYIDKTNEATIRNGEVALRTIVLINGGAAVAILAFLGAIAAKNQIEIGQLVAVSRAIIWFAAGVAAGASGLGLGYFTNYCHVIMAKTFVHSYDHPFVRNGAKTKRWEWIGRFFQILAFTAGLASIVLFVWGILEVHTAITMMAAKGSP